MRWSAALLVIGMLSAGCGGGAAGASREYSIRIRAEERGDEYVFVAEDPFDFRVGDRVTIMFRNAGELPHDLQVLDPEGTVLATAPALASGQSAEIEVEFDAPGRFRLNCNVDDHLIVHGMQATVEVSAAGGTSDGA